jgi:hypothetical protein
LRRLAAYLLASLSDVWMPAIVSCLAKVIGSTQQPET